MRVLTGIYQILNILNGKFYIGKSVNISKRWLNHKCYLRNNTSKNPYLQAAWNKYGENAFEFILIEICNKNELTEREQYWIDGLGAVDRELGYNLNPNSENSAGTKRSQETKDKISRANTGKIRTLEQRERISKSQSLRRKEQGTSQETRDKISAFHKGRSHPKETINRIALAHRKPDKWPHAWGVKCPCSECLEKRRAYARNYAREKLSCQTPN